MIDFDIWMDDAEMGYMARQSQIEAIIDALAAGGSKANDFNFQCSVYDACDFDSDTLTVSEIEYITRNVEKRLR